MEIEQIVEQLKSRNIEHITVTGHTDSNGIRPGASKEFPDNYALSRGRAGRSPGSLPRNSGSSRGSDRDRREGTRRTGCDQQDRGGTAAESPRGDQSRYCQAIRLDLYPQRQGNERHEDRVGHWLGAGRSLGPGPSGQARKRRQNHAGLRYGLDGEGADRLVLALAFRGIPSPIASTNIAIKHDPSKPFKLFLNGGEWTRFISTTRPRGRTTGSRSASGEASISRRRQNFRGRGIDDNNVETSRLKRVMHYSGSPVKAEIVPAQSTAYGGRQECAGHSRPADRQGRSSRAGGRMGEYMVDPPYLPRQRGRRPPAEPLDRADQTIANIMWERTALPSSSSSRPCRPVKRSSASRLPMAQPGNPHLAQAGGPGLDPRRPRRRHGGIQCGEGQHGDLHVRGRR